MAQAIKPDNVTPADELRALLALSEQRVVNLRGTGADALKLLLDLDRIDLLWPLLETQGVDLRPELGRWETLQAALRRYAPRLVSEMRVVGGLPAARRARHPDDQAAWWWFLAEQVQAQRTRALARTGITLGGTALIAGLLYYLIFRVLFPVDPNLRAAIEAQNAGELKITTQNDYAGALIDFRRATELRPGDPDTWLRVGCTLVGLGDTYGAEEYFRRAQVLLADDLAFRLSRAPACLLLGMVDYAEADLRAVIAINPEIALAHYYLSNILESRQAFSEALAALERAAELADRSQDNQLVAMARFRMGMLMQQMANQGLTGVNPTP